MGIETKSMRAITWPQVTAIIVGLVAFAGAYSFFILPQTVEATRTHWEKDDNRILEIVARDRQSVIDRLVRVEDKIDRLIETKK